VKSPKRISALFARSPGSSRQAAVRGRVTALHARGVRGSMNTSSRLVAGAASERSGRVLRPASTSYAAAQERLRIARDPLRVALFVLTIVTISRVHQHYPVLEKLRPALLLVVASVG
jgi:hypothetical protein